MNFDCHCGWEGDHFGAAEHSKDTGHDPLGMGAHGGAFWSELVDAHRCDLMDLSLDAMERGDHAEGLRLAQAHNDRMRAALEAKYGLGACMCGCITPSQTHKGSCPLYEDPTLRDEGAYEEE